MLGKVRLLAGLLVAGLVFTGFSQGVRAGVFFVPLGAVGKIAEIDSDSYQINRLIEGLGDAHGFGISADGRSLYVGSLVESKEAMTSVPKGVSEADHAAHHGAGSATATGNSAAVSFITRVDVRTGAIAKRINVERFTHHITVTPDGTRVIGVQTGANRIVVIDTANDRVAGYIPVGKTPNYAVVSGDGRRVYVSNSGSGTVSVLDGQAWTETSRISVGKGPGHMQLSGDGKRLYVVNSQSYELSVIDTATLREVNRVPTGKQPHGIATDVASGRLLVANTGDGSVSVYDPEGNSLSKFSLAPQPYHAQTGANGEDILITSRAKGRIWVISGKNLDIVKTIAVPGIGHQITYARQ